MSNAARNAIKSATDKSAHGLFERAMAREAEESDVFTSDLMAYVAASAAETFRLLARHWVWNTCMKRLEDDPTVKKPKRERDE